MFLSFRHVYSAIFIPSFYIFAVACKVPLYLRLSRIVDVKAFCAAPGYSLAERPRGNHHFRQKWLPVWWSRAELLGYVPLKAGIVIAIESQKIF